jgi:hypothetical protein
MIVLLRSVQQLGQEEGLMLPITVFIAAEHAFFGLGLRPVLALQEDL